MRGVFRFNWFRRPSVMAEACDELAAQMEADLFSQMSGLAGRVETYMKTNAPWNDRTYQARNELSARANITGRGNVTIIAKHGSPHGPYLETGTNYNPWTGRGNKAYPIVGPGLQAHYAEARKIMDSVASFGGGAKI